VAEDLAAALATSHPDARVALSWRVAPEQAGAALAWVVRALDLVRLDVLPDTPVVRCSEHAALLWLHAEPSVRQHLCQTLLAPLLAETPNSRAILSETLLLWLETRDSAPSIAARLEVHPQTVRYRWRRLQELFGEALRDPEQVVRMMFVLKATVPLWRAGDRHDLERFRRRSHASAAG
jgi:sugar diacid utilization regulator